MKPLAVKRMLAFLGASVLLALSLAPAAHTASGPRHHQAAAGARPPRLTLTPKVVAPGGRLTFVGSGFRPGEKVWLGVGPPQSEALHWGDARATRSGTFRKTFTVNRHVKPGRWVAIACQRGCRIKAGASFRTTLGKG